MSNRPSLSSAPPSWHVHPCTHRQCRTAGLSWLELNKLPRAWPWLWTREVCSQAPVGEATLNRQPQSQVGSSAQFMWASSFLMWVAYASLRHSVLNGPLLFQKLPWAGPASSVASGRTPARTWWSRWRAHSRAGRAQGPAALWPPAAQASPWVYTVAWLFATAVVYPHVLDR